MISLTFSRKIQRQPLTLDITDVNMNVKSLIIIIIIIRSKWLLGLSRGSAVPRFLGLRVQIPPPEVWMSVPCEV
jgi:hypothetical protein